jgi:hypothetical protein
MQTEFLMRSFHLSIVVVLCLVYGTVEASAAEWRRFMIPSTGASADVPISVFNDETELPDGGIGRRFFTNDRRADLTIQSVANSTNDSPATFLAKRNPPPDITYRRVTPSFFAVSSVRKDRIWYNRCNRAGRYMNCILINYPRAEKLQWDGIVTRISLTLAR